MDQSTLITILGSTFAIIFSMFGMFLWVRSEANADRRDMVQLIRAIQEEIKDFHTRLCIIEERNKK